MTPTRRQLLRRRTTDGANGVHWRRRRRQRRRPNRSRPRPNDDPAPAAPTDVNVVNADVQRRLAPLAPHQPTQGQQPLQLSPPWRDNDKHNRRPTGRRTHKQASKQAPPVSTRRLGGGPILSQPIWRVPQVTLGFPGRRAQVIALPKDQELSDTTSAPTTLPVAQHPLHLVLWSILDNHRLHRSETRTATRVKTTQQLDVKHRVHLPTLGKR